MYYWSPPTGGTWQAVWLGWPPGSRSFGQGLTPPELAWALAIGFSDALRVEIVDGRLSAVEEDLTEDLMRKYSGEDWLHEGREP